MHTRLSVSYAGFARAFDTRALCYRALLVDFKNKCTHICLWFTNAHTFVSYAGAFNTRALCYRALLVDFNNKCTHICLWFTNAHTFVCDLQMHTHLSVSYAGFARAFDTRALCYSWSTHFSVSYTAFARAWTLCYRALLVDFNNKCTHICLCVTLALLEHSIHEPCVIGHC